MNILIFTFKYCFDFKKYSIKVNRYKGKGKVVCHKGNDDKISVNKFHDAN